MRRINWELHLSVINNDLDRILEYIDMLEGASTQKNRALISMIEEEEKKLTPEEKKWWRKEMHGSRLAEITEAIPQIMWHGAFMTLMSYMEHTLLDQAMRHYGKVTHFAPELLPAGHPQGRRGPEIPTIHGANTICPQFFGVIFSSKTASSTSPVSWLLQ